MLWGGTSSGLDTASPSCTSDWQGPGCHTQQLCSTDGRAHLCRWGWVVVLQDHLDPEQGVRTGLAISVDGLGKLQQGPFDIEPEGLFQHSVHLDSVGHPVLLHLRQREKQGSIDKKPPPVLQNSAPDSAHWLQRRPSKHEPAPVTTAWRGVNCSDPSQGEVAPKAKAKLA